MARNNFKPRVYNDGVCFIVTGSEGQSGNGHQSVIDADLDTVGSQNTGGLLGEDVGVDTAVVGNSDQLVAALGLDPVGQALSGLTDDINVHAVGAGTQNAAQTGGTELQSDSETVLDLVLVALDLAQLSGQSLVLELKARPALVIIHVHMKSPILIIFEVI